MATEQPEEKVARPHLRIFFRMALGFWRGKSALRAWGITGLVLGFAAAQLATQLAINWWNRLFFDALERKSIADIFAAIGWLPFILTAAAIFLTGLVVSRMLMQARWREWVTNHLSGWWIADQRYYRLNFAAPDHTVPEFRIAEDVRLSVEPLVEFSIGLISSFFTGVTFAAVLWQVAGSARIPIGGTTIEIPAYMALAAILYAIVASTAAYYAGRPLVAKVSHKNDMEAQFRAEMTRLRENAESIALIRGDKDERESVGKTYQLVVQAWLRIVRQQGIIGIVLNTNGALFPIVPLLLATPKYLSGDLTLGGVMQVTAAFAAVQAALVWFVDNFVRLAEWYASVGRVDELMEVLEDLDAGTIMEEDSGIDLGESDDDSIHIDNLSVAHSNGRVMIEESTITIERGEKVLVTGESGSGKSTLIRALAGLWPWGSGSIRVPRGVEIAFVPQKPYLPHGTLRAALLYPHGDAPIADDVIHAAMKRCNLSYLARRLDDEERWDQILSGGERQRVAFCRLLLQKPAIIILDEATSALDEDSQASLLDMFSDELKDSTILSVGHRPGLEDYHTRKITLTKRAAGARMKSQDISRPWWQLVWASNSN